MFSVSRLTLAAVLLATVISASAQAQTIPGQGQPALQSTGFLIEGRWYDLDFAKGSAPNYGPGTECLVIPTVKINRVINDDWVEIAYPLEAKRHAELAAARSADERYGGRVTMGGPAVRDWEKSVPSWRLIWIHLKYVVSISPLE